MKTRKTRASSPGEDQRPGRYQDQVKEVSNAETNKNASTLRDPAYMTVQEAASWLSLSDAAVRRLLTQKLLRRFKVCGVGSGRRTLVLFDEVKSLIAEVK
jgi:excisionase family DNA binding protein